MRNSGGPPRIEFGMAPVSGGWLALLVFPLLLAGVFAATGPGGLVAAGATLMTCVAFLSATGRLGSPARYRPNRSSLPDRASALRLLSAHAGDGRLGGREFACIAVAFDRPEELRDRLGDAAFDRLLAGSPARLADRVRANDIVARLDTASFAVFLMDLPRADIDMLLGIAGRLQRALAEGLDAGENACFPTVSAGLCLANRAPEPTPEGLLRGAEVALHAARSETGGTLRAYSAELESRARSLSLPGGGIAAALAEGQIGPWFQPQVSAATGVLTGVEALARWAQPDGSVRGAEDVIPAATAAGLADRLGETIRARALAALVEWDAAGCDVPGVALNLSRHELRNPRLADQIRWDLDRFEIAPARLTLELRDLGTLASGEETVLRNIRTLAEVGCRIDLDEFGSVLSSIADIRRFDVHRLKIDRSLVARIDSDPEQRRLAAAVLGLAAELGLDAVAVGVETEGEARVLAELGCSDLQGFAIALPMPADALARWTQSRPGHREQGQIGAPGFGPELGGSHGKTA